MGRLPPLNALRAFEVVARQGSLTKAADELLVTSTAVGRHVRHLEDALGVRLFHREAGVLTLTDHGRRYSRSLARAFELISDATLALEDDAARVQLSLRAYTTFLIRWLIPRLPGFQAEHPDVRLKLTAGHEPVDFKREPVDMSVRYGSGRWTGLVATRLFEDELVAFAAPDLAARAASMPMAEALARIPVIVHLRRQDDWSEYLAMVGSAGGISGQRIDFDDLALVYQAALDGLGIALSQLRYIARDVADGRLRQVWEPVLRRQRGYYLVCPHATASAPAVKAFTRWVIKAVDSPSPAALKSVADEQIVDGRSRRDS